jgi:chromosomal replication initiator protein
MNTLDAAGLDGARIIVASDEHPKEITKLSDRLVSRFMAGAVVKIEPPDAELRGRLIRHLAQKRGLPLDDEAATLLAERSSRSAGAMSGFGGSVREMEGLLNQVDAVHRLLPEYGLGSGTISVPLVRKALGIDQQQETPVPTMRVRRPMNAEAIVAEVCRELAVDLNDFMGKGRHKRVVLARSLVASLSRRLTTMSFPEIARSMGRSNHSTIITAQKRIDRQITDDVGRPLSAELAAGHAGRTLRELNDHLFRTLQRG